MDTAAAIATVEIVITHMVVATEDMAVIRSIRSILHPLRPVQQEQEWQQEQQQELLGRLELQAPPVLLTTPPSTPSTMVVLIHMQPTEDTRTILPITSTTNKLLSNSSSSLKARHLHLLLVKLLRRPHLLALARRLRHLPEEVVIMLYAFSRFSKKKKTVLLTRMQVPPPPGL